MIDQDAVEHEAIALVADLALMSTDDERVAEHPDCDHDEARAEDTDSLDALIRRAREIMRSET